MRFLLIALIMILPKYSNGQSELIKHGSLVVITMSKDGLVVTADQKVNQQMGGKQIEAGVEAKITQLDKYHGFSITGQSGISFKSNKTGAIVDKVEAKDVVISYFANKKTVALSMQEVDSAATEIVKAYMGLMQRHQHYYKFANYHLYLLLYGWNTALEKFDIGICRIEYDAAKGISVTPQYGQLNESSDPMPFGVQDVFLGLQEQNSAVFRTFHDQDWIMKFVRKPVSLFPSEDVLKFNEWLIQETSKHSEEVGDKTDAIIINSDGLKWIR